MEFQNGCMMRKAKEKPGPSGMSHNQAFSLPEAWGGRNCLLRVDDFSIIKILKEKLGSEELVSFSTPEFLVHAQEAYDFLAIIDLTFKNIWAIFTAILPLSFN